MNIKIQGKWGTLFKHTNDAVVVIDANNSQVLEANANALDLLGYSLSFLQKSYFSDFLMNINANEWQDLLRLVRVGFQNEQDSKIATKVKGILEVNIKVFSIEEKGEQPLMMLILKEEASCSQEMISLKQRLLFYETILMQMPLSLIHI